MEDGDICSYQDPARLRQRRGRRGVYEDDQLASMQEDEHRDDAEEPQANFSLFDEERSRRDGTGETRRTISWIWRDHDIAGGSDDNILRSEWAKSRARAQRTTEEVMLLKEEMRRVLEFFAWTSRAWEEMAASREDEAIELKEGLRAYALERADLHQRLGAHFRELWKAPLADPLFATAPKTGVAEDDNYDDNDDDDDEDDNNNNNSNGDERWMYDMDDDDE